jgi:hypothetical protein
MNETKNLKQRDRKKLCSVPIQSFFIAAGESLILKFAGNGYA